MSSRTTSPLVSIITPSYNQGQFIGDTIRSVLDQDYRNIELIVVDGGSTDSTLDVLRSFDDPRLTWISEKDDGQSDAINKGMRLAKGEILSYLNSDDMLMPGAVRFTVQYFEQHPEVEAIFGDTHFINETGQIIGAFQSRPYSVASAIIGGQPNPQPGTFWRRGVMERIGLFDVSLRYCMDFDYWVRMGLAGIDLHYVPGFRALFRFHSASKSVSQLDRFVGEMVRIVDRIYAAADVPDDLRAVRSDAYEYLEWFEIKMRFAQGSRAELRPRLSKMMRSSRRGRRVLAALMYLDCTFSSPFTRMVSYAYFRLRGTHLLPI